jgi:translation initiation factor eIF-2B subunit epsilon
VKTTEIDECNGLTRDECLLPLANTPLIEYTLEFLANAGVEEVILYCGNHTDQVEEYLKYELEIAMV